MNGRRAVAVLVVGVAVSLAGALSAADLAAAAARVVACPNTMTRQGVLLHRVSARDISCQAVHAILRRATLPPTSSPTLRWGSATHDAPHGWRFDTRESVFYTTKRHWDLADICGSTERLSSGSRALRFTWGHRSRWVQRYVS